MAQTIKGTFKAKHGPEATIPTLDEAVFGYTTDSNKVYIGSSSNGNVQLAKQTDLDVANSNIASKANQSDLNAANTNIGQKADKSYVDSQDALKLDKTSIVDVLTSTDSTVPLSANQGKVLKGLVDSNTTSLAQKTYYFDTVSAMKSSNQLKNGDHVITKGYYSPNDGGGAEYQIVSSTTLSAFEGGGVHTLSNGLYAEIIIKNGVITADSFGCKGYVYEDMTSFTSIHNPVDSSSFLQNAINYIYHWANNNYKISFSGKYYFIHEIQFTKNPILMIGTEWTSTKLIYNGNGGTGSYLFIHKKNSGGDSADGGFQNIYLSGCYVYSDCSPCEYAIASNSFITGTVSDGIDFGYLLNYVAFEYFLKSPIALDGGINFHMEHIRFDHVNEFPIYFKEMPNSFSLNDFTVDFGSSDENTTMFSAFKTAKNTANGGTGKCGYGLMYIEHIGIASCNIENARIEDMGGLRAYNGKRGIVFINNNDDQTGVISLKNLELSTNDVFTYVQFLRNGSCNVTIENAANAYEGIFVDRAIQTRDVLYPRWGYAKPIMQYSTHSGEGGLRGILIDNKKISSVRSITSPDNDYYRYGDIVYRSIDYAQENQPANYEGWMCVFPTQGVGKFVTAPAPTTNISTTSGGTTLTGKYNPYTSYTITYSNGLTQVLMCSSYDKDSNTSTFNTAFSQTDSGAKIAITIPVFKEFGTIAKRLSALPTTGTYYQGEIIYNSSPSSGGYIGWVCTGAGILCANGWVASTAYTVGQQVFTGGKVYQCTTAGTSGTTAPSGTGSSIADGSVVWAYINNYALFKTFGLIS